MRISLLRVDFFALLWCIAVAHVSVGNPYYGATIYLFTDIIKSYFLCDLSRLRHPDGGQYLSKLLLALVFMGGIAVSFFYPMLSGQRSAVYVSLCVVCFVMRDYFASTSALSSEEKHRAGRYVSQIFIHLSFNAACAYLLSLCVSGMVLYILLGALLLTSVFRIIVPEKQLIPGNADLENKYEIIASYKLFSDMNLYAAIAINLGVMMVVFNILMTASGAFDLRLYGAIVLWMLFVSLCIFITMALIKTRWRNVALAEFIAGAVIWLTGMIGLHFASTIVLTGIWTMIWGLGIALMFAAIRKFYIDFEAVGKILGEDYDKHKLEISNAVVAASSSIVSSSIMLILMAYMTFSAAGIATRLPKLPSTLLAYLPIAFMLVAIVFALKSPFDYRNREKLMRFVSDRSKNENFRENLDRLFVEKYRMRFGIKIICTMARPFLRLKVSGMQNLRKESYPSVFVCNHGFIYGPISAVIYLPTYFRPWIHNVMLQKDSARRELNHSLAFLRKYLGFVGTGIINLLTRVVCWALNSFNPIPVVRGASRDVMSTLNESLKALEEGDNILIFPEKPKALAGLSEDADATILRSFYTGFAHIGKMYFDRTGKSLLFYPLYSDRKRRMFSIGEPVPYNSSLESHESKHELAEQLQLRLEALAKGEAE